jgi:dUTP pyrophosphatase
VINYFLENPEWSLEKATIGASGYDVRCALGCEREINPGERWKISTGLYLAMSIGIEAQVRSRSGLSLNHGVVVLNAPGTIDSDYRDEVGVVLINLGKIPYTVKPGDRIAQIVFAPVYPDCHYYVGDSKSEFYPTRVPDKTMLSQTHRTGGFGSTGR